MANTEGNLVVVFILSLITWYFWPAPEETDNYKLGFSRGLDVGHYEERQRICDKIEDELNSGARDAFCN